MSDVAIKRCIILESDSYTDIKMEKLYGLSRYVSRVSGITPQKNKAITGDFILELVALISSIL